MALSISTKDPLFSMANSSPSQLTITSSSLISSMTQILIIKSHKRSSSRGKERRSRKRAKRMKSRMFPLSWSSASRTSSTRSIFLTRSHGSLRNLSSDSSSSHTFTSGSIRLLLRSLSVTKRSRSRANASKSLSLFPVSRLFSQYTHAYTRTHTPQMHTQSTQVSYTTSIYLSYLCCYPFSFFFHLLHVTISLHTSLTSRYISWSWLGMLNGQYKCRIPFGNEIPPKPFNLLIKSFSIICITKCITI